MVKVYNVFEMLRAFAPVELKESFDNVGLLVGEGNAEVTRVLVALDVTLEVVEEAKRIGAQLIVAHHPVFFSINSVTDREPAGRLVLSLIKSGVSAISMHTNLDKVEGGVNDMLAAALGLRDIELLVNEGLDAYGRPYGLGRIGTLPEPMDMERFVDYVGKALGCKGLRYRDSGLPVSRVAVGGGTCGDYIPQVIEAGCDTFVTADLKYNMFLSAPEKGVNLVDAGHYPTENVVCGQLKRVISSEFPELTVSISDIHEEHVGYRVLD